MDLDTGEKGSKGALEQSQEHLENQEAGSRSQNQDCLLKYHRRRTQGCDRNPYRCRCGQVDRCQTCCLCFCFSAWLEEFGGPLPRCGSTDRPKTGRGRRHLCAHPRVSVKKMESLSWLTARSWDYHLCPPTSALSPLTCE